MGGRKDIRYVKKASGGGWCSYLSGARCRFAYGEDDLTAMHCVLLQEIHVGFCFTFLILAHLVSPRQNPDSHKTVVVVVVV